MLKKASISVIAAIASCISICLMHAQQPATPPTKAAPKGAVTGRLSLVDRKGKVASTVAGVGEYRTLSISTDGRRAAFERTDPQIGNRDIWLAEFSSGKLTRFTSDPAWEAFPTWSPDGKRIIFTSNRAGQFDLYERPSDASKPEELLYKSEIGKGPTSWSGDGRFLLYYTLGQPTHAMLISLQQPEPVPMLDPQFTSITARFSPDGRWIACVSNESGTDEISIRSFNPPSPGRSSSFGKPIVISKGGGTTPLWRADGKEIFYISTDRMATAVELDPKTKTPSGPPRSLFKPPDGVLFWDVLPDGSRFLIPVP